MAFNRNSSNNVPTTPPFIYRPPQVPLHVEGYPVAPEGLELEQVHVYVRHGERAPVGIRLADPPASVPEHWVMCNAAREFRAAVSGVTSSSAKDNPIDMVQTRRAVERRNGVSVHGECLLGELTDIGRQSTLNYGSALRKLYIDRLGFLSESLAKPGEIYLRSTNMPRTMESLQEIVHGLCPSDKCNLSTIPSTLVRNGKDENLYGNTYACKRLELLQIGFAKAAAAAYNPTLEPLDKKLSKYLGGDPIRLDGRPRASGILDTVRAATAHGIKVPTEFEDKSVMETIERAVLTEWFGDKTEEVRRLGMGPLLGDMLRKMQQKADKGVHDPLKMLIHSTHDTAIAAMCATLDVFDDRWPAFTASVTFELFKRERSEAAGTTRRLFSPFKQKAPVDHC
ncbi:hypothetical protein AX17_001730 [Amanita inopinata Kibby_2008]|nr:hypothetical protein AX17_001730 [Amanita inopinata Kibby_2008]